jgi:hypothetical protein
MIACVPSVLSSSTSSFASTSATKTFPTFTSNRDWFNVKLAKEVNPTKSLTYSTHLNATNRAFMACNISSTKKTHAGRGREARQWRARWFHRR